MPLEDLIRHLEGSDIGQIFLLQAARSLLQADEIKGSAKDELKTFLEFSERKLSSATNSHDIELLFFLDGVYNRPERFFLDCEDVLQRDSRLVTVLTYDTLHELLCWNKANPERPPNSEAKRRRKIQRLNQGAGPGQKFAENVRLGTKKGTDKNILWVTDFDTMASLAPELRDSTDLDELSPGASEHIRDFLGLRHLMSGDELVLCLLREGAVERHLGADGSKAARPFLFEGGANPRFHLYARNCTAPGWNRAFNLKSAVDAEVGIDGAPEAVLSGVSCAEIDRLIWLGSPGTPPCNGRSDKVLIRMQRNLKLSEAKRILREFA